VLALGGFDVLGKSLKSGSFPRLWENIPFVGVGTTLVVRGNI
jgi:hypothetical protein